MRSARVLSVFAALLMVFSLMSGATAAPPEDMPTRPTAEEMADVQPRDLVIDERGLGYLRTGDGRLIPYGHSVAAERSPEPRAPGGNPGRPGGGGGGGDGTVTFGDWSTGQVMKSAGRILFEMSDGWYVCSGTVVADEVSGRSVILTAAHCIYDDVGKAFAKQAIFIPNQDDGGSDRTDWDCSNDPYGCWVISHGVVDVNWTTRTFPSNIPWDYGFYVVSDSGARSQTPDYQEGKDGALDGIVGALVADFTDGALDETPKLAADAHALGYSYNVDPEFKYCQEPLSIESSYGDYWLGSCDMSGGSSGGPWIQPMDGSGSGPVFSVNSWGYTRQPGMAGPPLHGNSASELFAAATDLASSLGVNLVVIPGSGGGADDTTKPVASFSSSCSALTCSFTDSSSDNVDVVSRSWDFGDDETSTATNPSHTYAAAGTYTVTLTVLDAAGNSDQTSNSVTVSEDVISATLEGSSRVQGRSWSAIVTLVGQPGDSASGTWMVPGYDGEPPATACSIGAGESSCEMTLRKIPLGTTEVTYTDRSLGSITVPLNP